MQKGKFIVFEGGEGSGKGTQISLLQKELAGANVVWTREPGGTKIGEKIRELILSGESTDMRAKTELLLFYASRAQHMEEIIIPALESGRHVISDRFSLTTIAYQVYAREQLQLLPLYEMLDADVVGKYIPDLTVFLDIDPVHAIARTNGRADNNRLDVEPLAFHERARNGYLEALKKIPHRVVNSDRAPEEVFKDISSIVKERFGT